MAQPHNAEAQQALAALYALGALDPEDAAAFATHATEPAAEWHTFARVAEMLGAGVTPVSPPARLRERLLARLQPHTTASPDTPPSIPSAVQVVRAAAGQWRDGPAPGLFLKMLFYDATRQYATQLLRLAPGASIPPHVHSDTEELYVLEGSCALDQQTFYVGDYMRMAAGTSHNRVVSAGGCLLLLRGSTRTVMLP